MEARPRTSTYRARGGPRPQGPYELHRDIKPDPEGVYGYTLTDDSSLHRLKLNGSDPDSVGKARAKRIPYREGMKEKRKLARAMEKEGHSDESIARAMVEKRNTGREATYGPVEVEQVKQRNLDEYGREDGPTYEMLRTGQRAPGKDRAKPKTDREIIVSATRDNPGMNALVGLDRPGPSTPASAIGGAAARSTSVEPSLDSRPAMSDDP